MGNESSARRTFNRSSSTTSELPTVQLKPSVPSLHALSADLNKQSNHSARNQPAYEDTTFLQNVLDDYERGLKTEERIDYANDSDGNRQSNDSMPLDNPKNPMIRYSASMIDEAVADALTPLSDSSENDEQDADGFTFIPKENMIDDISGIFKDGTSLHIVFGFYCTCFESLC